MSTLERGMLRYMQEKTADVIARGKNLLGMLFILHQTCFLICKEKLQMPLQEERNLLMVVFRLHQQAHLLLIHQLQKVQGKINLRRHIARMAEVCHFLRRCNLFCSVINL
jgi:hypothetical protein